MEEKYLPILLKTEKVIIEAYNHGKIETDNSVKIVVEALIYRYKKGRDISHNMTIYDSELKDKIEFKLKENVDQKITGSVATKEDILACLNILMKSISFWSKTNGSRGYLEYVKGFIGKNTAV